MGKSEFIYQLIKYREEMFTSKFCRIIFCQPETLSHRNSEIVKKLKELFPQIELHYGLPDVSKLNLDLNTLPCLLIMDDLMQQILNSSSMVDFFAVKVHHYNISCIFTLQNYFIQTRFSKSILRNVQYKIFFYNRVDQVELRNISMQIMPNAPDFMLSNFKFLEENIQNKFANYILVDGHTHSKLPHLHIRSQIFPNSNGEIIPIIFSPNVNYRK